MPRRDNQAVRHLLACGKSNDNASAVALPGRCLPYTLLPDVLRARMRWVVVSSKTITDLNTV